ncbi:uncharacterized protein VTP21DRAFT_4695 [Calcarisporiella thermophila]|uniref:uncharacterized protein n=1 Tax=Calcarisporiella thermophila TaxID=911321 RepID=UPI0037421B4F
MLRVTSDKENIVTFHPHHKTPGLKRHDEALSTKFPKTPAIATPLANKSNVHGNIQGHQKMSKPFQTNERPALRNITNKTPFPAEKDKENKTLKKTTKKTVIRVDKSTKQELKQEIEANVKVKEKEGDDVPDIEYMPPPVEEVPFEPEFDIDFSIFRHRPTADAYEYANIKPVDPPTPKFQPERLDFNDPLLIALDSPIDREISRRGNQKNIKRLQGVSSRLLANTVASAARSKNNLLVKEKNKNIGTTRIALSSKAGTRAASADRGLSKGERGSKGKTEK